MIEDAGDIKIYTTGNINATSANHYNLSLRKDQKMSNEQLQYFQFQYDKLEREEQELIMAILAAGDGDVVFGDDGSGRLKMEVDMLNLINFLGFSSNGGKIYKKIRKIIEDLAGGKKVRKILIKRTEKGVTHELTIAPVISLVKFTERDDNKLYLETNVERFRRINITVFFSETFTEILSCDTKVVFFLRNKNLLKKIQKQPVYVRDVINYMIPIMGDADFYLDDVIKEKYKNDKSAKSAKQRLLKAYKENKDIRDLFLLCGIKIDVENKKIIKRTTGFTEDGKRIDPIFFVQ